MPIDMFGTLTFPKFSKILINVSTKFAAENFNPKRPFSCETMMMTDVADVNPDVTGSDIKSTRKPGRT